MRTEWFLWAYGAGGAFLFGSGVLVLSLWGEAAADSHVSRDRKVLAIVTFINALVAGGFTAQVLAPTAQHMLASGVEVNGVRLSANWPCPAIAASLGFLWNLLSPVLSSRLLKWAQTWNPKL